jgi:hypothetical protein
MGGDMSLAGFEKPEKMSMADFKAKLLANVEALTLEADVDAIESFFENLSGDIPETIDMEQVKKQFKDIIEETIKHSEYRDVTIYHHKGIDIYLSGGMSWATDQQKATMSLNSSSTYPKKLRRWNNGQDVK